MIKPTAILQQLHYNETSHHSTNRCLHGRRKPYITCIIFICIDIYIWHTDCIIVSKYQFKAYELIVLQLK